MQILREKYTTVYNLHATLAAKKKTNRRHTHSQHLGTEVKLLFNIIFYIFILGVETKCNNFNI